MLVPQLLFTCPSCQGFSLLWQRKWVCVPVAQLLQFMVQWLILPCQQWWVCMWIVNWSCCAVGICCILPWAIRGLQNGRGHSCGQELKQLQLCATVCQSDCKCENMNVGMTIELLRTTISVFCVLGRVRLYWDSLNGIVSCLNHWVSMAERRCLYWDLGIVCHFFCLPGNNWIWWSWEWDWGHGLDMLPGLFYFTFLSKRTAFCVLNFSVLECALIKYWFTDLKNLQVCQEK